MAGAARGTAARRARRTRARSAALPRSAPALRADLLSVAVRCAAAALDASVVDDLMALDGETRALPDLGRNLKVVLFATCGARRARAALGRPRAAPPKRPRLRRAAGRGESDAAATTARLIEAAAAVLAGEPAPRDAPATARASGSAGEPPAGDRAALCAEIQRLGAGAAARARNAGRPRWRTR